MAKKQDNPQVKSGEGRVSYPHVFEKHSFLDSKPVYELTLLFPKANNSVDVLKVAASTAVKAYYGDKPVPENFRSPFVDGDTVAEKKGEAYGGCWAVKFKSNNRPGVVDVVGLRPLETEEFYAGCWAIVTAKAWVYEKGTPGISFWIDNICKIRNDDPFATGSTSASNDFEDECQEAGADDAANYDKPETSDKGIFG